MRKLFLISCVFVLVITTMACMGMMGPQGAIYTNITSPGVLANSTTYQITPESDFEGIAYVEGIAVGQVVLGLVATGDFGYAAAIEDALLKAPGATRLIDIVVDVHVKSILGIYTVFTTKVRGRAVRVRKK